MKHDHIKDERAAQQADENESETTPELEGISPLNRTTFPRAEDDPATRANSPEFRDLPDPGPNVGRRNPGHNY